MSSENDNPITTDSLEANVEISKGDLFKDEEERFKARRRIVFETMLDSAGRAEEDSLIIKLIEVYNPSIPIGLRVKTCENSYLYGNPDSVWVLVLQESKSDLCKPFGINRQFIFDAAGHLIYEDSAAQFELIKIWEDKKPLLMTLNTDCNGNGQHHFYKYQSGELIDVFNVLLESTPHTYDDNATDDDQVYYPAILKLKLEDKNGDGMNDLLFFGERLILKDADDKKYSKINPYKREKIEYVFLYESGEDWFVMH